MKLTKLAYTGSLLIVGLGLDLCSTSTAATIRVPQDQPTITAGVAAAQNGDTVAVSSGTYDETNIQITHAITLTSLTGSTNTIIDCQQKGRGLVINNATSAKVNIIGFTIQNAQIPDYQGGAAINVLSGKCDISGCIIQGASGPGDYTGAPISNGTNIDDVLVENCIVRNNFAANGCGIGNCAVRSCLIYNNSAGNNPMALATCHATNCTVYGNTGGFLSNPWTVGGMNGGTADNCIFWGNSGYNGQQVYQPVSVTYRYYSRRVRRDRKPEFRPAFYEPCCW